jgi:site-specific DNA-adenine methylase
MILNPFFPYLGPKHQIAGRYPTPKYSTIIEPFAGSAGYACRYSNRNVVLVDKYEVIADIWKFLVSDGAAADEIRKSKYDINHTSELDPDTPKPLKDLIGFHMGWATTSPGHSLTSGNKRKRYSGRDAGWSLKTRNKNAHQTPYIKHWNIIKGEYRDAPDIEATWHIDPPYRGDGIDMPGIHYKHGSDEIDYDHLAHFCKTRKGQVIVCESEGADWLPFWELTEANRANRKKGKYKELIWTNDPTYRPSKKYFQGWGARMDACQVI